MGEYGVCGFVYEFFVVLYFFVVNNFWECKIWLVLRFLVVRICVWDNFLCMCDKEYLFCIIEDIGRLKVVLDVV